MVGLELKILLKWMIYTGVSPYIGNHHAIGATNPHGSRGVLLSSSDTKKDEDYEAMLRREVEVISMAIHPGIYIYMI